ncbi:MAG: tetratricopeptide repeat protein [Gammaproteobacteria bacterium]
MKNPSAEPVREHLRFARTWLATALTLSLAHAVVAATFEDGEAALRRGDSATAIPIFTALAAQGDAAAMARLGALYQKGEGVPRDLARAVAYYTDGATRGNPDALFNLGNLYLLGEGVPQDDDWAFTYYRQAAQQGHTLAQKNVNEFYRAAGLTPPPAESAAPAAPESLPAVPEAETIAPAAETTIGQVPADYSADELRAMEHLRARGIQVDLAPGAATAVPPPAPVNLALAPPPAVPPADSLSNLKRRLAAGETSSVKADLEVLADAGHVEAQFLLARVLATLQPRGDGETIMWLKLAAQGGHAEAQFALAEAYRRGQGVAVDDAEAVTWYRAAARQGHAGARQQLDALYRAAGLQAPPTYGKPPAR